MFLLVVAMVVSLFGVRLFQLQGLDPKAYAAKAREQGAVTAVLPAKRGEILDRTGSPLAQSVQGRMLIADPALTRPYAAVIARVLADRLDVDYFDTLAKLTKKNSRFQYLARRIPSTQATAAVTAIQAKIKPLIKDKEKRAVPFGGVTLMSDPLRSYPGKDVAANLLGFINANGQPSGLELSFDKLLSGKDGKQTYEVGGGNRIPLGQNTTVEPRNGKDLELTIDRDTQWYVQRVLCNAVEGSGAESGSAVVMRPGTGEVLALADCPTFDANDPSTAKKGTLGAPSLQNVYEPGSVEKVLTVSSLLDAHKVTPRTKITVAPELHVADRTIHDWFTHPVLHLTMTGVIAKSSNIGTAEAATQLTHEQLYDKLREFGLGSRTGVGLAGETAGLVPDWHSWSAVNQATIAFGQGISVNTLQMAAAINTIANHGVYVSPSLVKGSATTDSGQQVGTDHTTKRRVVSTEAATKMTRMMEMVPNPETGTAPGAQVAGYRVAGKTGTAQEVDPKCKCYGNGFTVSFAGFAPADKPAFTVYVVINKPTNGGGGGSIGGPAFSKIQSFLLQRYGVTPTGTKAPNLPIYWGSDLR
ncbi:penicillin-binding protein 2 [Nocardioides mangrovicus]|uniref:Penicillin-binding protein 2 n=2 Tax=Nocardioides mangrovicus TaxID=2478913 RepID=A0A3L8P1W9_9ACTN|nr:penicillin-binding protein 2 [Nocardioides mangrovicus]